MGFEFTELDLKGAVLIKGFYAGDNRGSLTKTFEIDAFSEAGISFSLNETFASCSMRNVLRGLHFQTEKPQAKIVSVLVGRVWDVIVDLRPNSLTFKQWRAQELSSTNHLSFYVPRGFAHGFFCLEDDTIVLYQCEGKYNKNCDTGIRYDDREIGIKWPMIGIVPIVSSRDLALQSFTEYQRKPMQL